MTVFIFWFSGWAVDPSWEYQYEETGYSSQPFPWDEEGYTV